MLLLAAGLSQLVIRLIDPLRGPNHYFGGAAMLGHWRPVFMGFAKGGKMVATPGGALLGVAPLGDAAVDQIVAYASGTPVNVVNPKVLESANIRR